MMLIADSGSTKTHWCLVDNNGKKLIQTIGINPYQMNYEAIKEVLENDLFPFLSSETIKDIHFYGAGCSTDQKCNQIDSVLQDFFKTANIEVHHDLLGAARALCGHERGIACILGTGCNSCYYDGDEIKEQIYSLGYVLGDEGSGAYMGKLLIRDFYQNRMPADIQHLFQQDFNPVLEHILDNIYNQPRPNRYLASFSPFLLKNIDQPYVYELVSNSFDDFLSKYVLKFKEAKSAKVHFLGSIAYHFSDVLKASAAKAGLEIGTIYESPIQGLVDYHIN
ncbi:MAG: ATPase [Lentimicrobium sp.]|jgi:N-acetylglucosamine kinase-like BadF-type ATPase|nr:ATPase [Lentimicrobium sp.]